MPRPSPLRALADRVGILPEYVDQTGKERRRTSDETRVAILRAMGFEAGTERDAQRALEALEARERNRVLAPVRVVPLARARAARAEVTLPDELRRDTVRWELELVAEDGTARSATGRARPSRSGTIAIPIPAIREIGYHTLRVRLDTGGDGHDGEQSLIVVPPACPAPADRLGARGAMGIIANLYTIRDERNWGVGDLEDLARLLVWSAAIGAEFVGINPLHALRNRGMDISPYSPVSRVWRNPIYLAPERVPELAESPAARALLESADARRELASLRASDRVEYERVWTLKRAVLRELHATFAAARRERESPRGAAYAEWRRARGEALVQFATFTALDEHFTREGRDGGFPSWPEEFRDPRSPAVREFAAAHEDDIDFHCWVQFELDRQLADAAGRGAMAGLALGLYQDLAIGTSPAGSDVWSFPELFVRGVSIGAPPDPYSATGQNWGLPPIDPRRLREDRYRYWIALVRASLRHAGALRIDHVMGLFRQFWIPEGMSGTKGAYVEFPANDLLGILALESTRAGAIVVGEDLGTVPEEVPPALERWGILSSKVLYFERDARGRFRPASSYPRLSLATANTHDMATLAGFWTGRDVELRQQVGLSDERQTREARRERARDRELLVERFVAEGVLGPAGGSPADSNGRRPAGRSRARPPRADELDELRVRAATHAFLCRTPSVLVGLMLDDLAGETEPVNVPGVGPDRYPSWTRRLRLSLAELAFDAAAAATIRCGERSRAEPGPGARGRGKTERPRGATSRPASAARKPMKDAATARSTGATKRPNGKKRSGPRTRA